MAKRYDSIAPGLGVPRLGAYMSRDETPDASLTPTEETLARIVEVVLDRDEGRNLGSRTIHDFNDGDQLAIDLTYDRAVPPVALELTTVQDDDFLATSSYTRGVSERLSSVAESERLGAWEVTVSEDGDLSTMEAIVTEVLRGGEDVHAMRYTSDDLRRWQRDGSLPEEIAFRKRLATAGVEEVKRSSVVVGVAVHTWGSSEGEFQGVLDLDEVVDSNVKKIAAAKREGHLAVGVGRFRVSHDPLRTPVPTLPSAMTRIWLVRLWYAPESGYPVWSARAGETEWTIHPPVKLDD